MHLSLMRKESNAFAYRLVLNLRTPPYIRPLCGRMYGGVLKFSTKQQFGGCFK